MSLRDHSVSLDLHINGDSVSAELDPRTTLLDFLREHRDLTGTKKGCNHGQCGACTVLVEGRRLLSCLTLAAVCDGSEVTTVEGLGGEQAHPMQEAFIACDAYQCGYCTPGQIMSAIGLLDEPWGAEDDAVREAMSGNLCRCGAYPKIISAVQQVRAQKEEEVPRA